MTKTETNHNETHLNTSAARAGHQKPLQTAAKKLDGAIRTRIAGLTKLLCKGKIAEAEALTKREQFPRAMVVQSAKTGMLYCLRKNDHRAAAKDAMTVHLRRRRQN